MTDLGRKWVAAVVMAASVLLASAAMGTEHDPCYGAYLDSGLTEQQMSFDQFRHSYKDTLCAKSDEPLAVAHEAQALRTSR